MISQRKFVLKSLILILLVSFIYTTCTHEADLSELPEVCFTKDILPVFINNCSMAGCHDGSGESSYTFGSYQEIMAGVEPGFADKSPVYLSLIEQWGGRMPPDRPLAIEDRMRIRVWIDQGAAQTTCADDGQGSIYLARACFTRDVLPVIVSHCATSGCHDAITHEEGYNFTSYANIRNVVRAGNPGESKLIEVITKTDSDDKMPPAGSLQLTAVQIDTIRKWISYGALNEACGEACDTISRVNFSGTIHPFMQTTCTGCHSGTAPSGNINLTSYTNVAVIAANGLLLKSLKGVGATRMPPTGPLSACRLTQFEKWIKNGFPEN